MHERRISPRQRSFLGARIAYDRRRTTMDGLVRNLSAGGAKLAFPATVSLPAELDLIIPHTGLDTRVRIVWRSPDAIGLAFLEPARQGDVVPVGIARRLRAMAEENAALKRRIAQLSGD
jgi:hypothetical protein